MSKGSGSAGRASAEKQSGAKVSQPETQADKYAISEERRKFWMNRYMSLEEGGEDWERAFFSTYRNHGELTHEEAAVLFEYTDYGAQDRSARVYRKEALEEKELALMGTMDNALRKLDITRRTVYRGVYMDRDKLSALREGGVYQSPYYMSASFSAEQAREFAMGESGGTGAVILRIKGGARDISRYSSHGLERESVVPRNTRYRIKKIQKNGRFTYVDLEL